ncbi:MAG: hypothetical protein EGR90_01675 [Lachnospiraceae bacterium]|nr:hypothetical protein [Lachnospiraceae bacterium]
MQHIVIFIPAIRPEEVNVMFEMPGKLKAGTRQDSKSRKPLQKLQDGKGQSRDAKYLWKV